MLTFSFSDRRRLSPATKTPTHFISFHVELSPIPTTPSSLHYILCMKTIFGVREEIVHATTLRKPQISVQRFFSSSTLHISMMLIIYTHTQFTYIFLPFDSMRLTLKRILNFASTSEGTSSLCCDFSFFLGFFRYIFGRDLTKFVHGRRMNAAECNLDADTTWTLLTRICDYHTQGCALLIRENTTENWIRLRCVRIWSLLMRQCDERWYYTVNLNDRWVY